MLILIIRNLRGTKASTNYPCNKHARRIRHLIPPLNLRSLPVIILLLTSPFFVKNETRA